MRKTKGAVTVFLIIVLFSTTLLGGLFIDATRVLLAKRVIRNTLDSSARSALSYYDEHLASEYGLFAVDKEEAEEAFVRYFKTNLKLAQNDGFDILRMDVKDDNIAVEACTPVMDQKEMLDAMEDYSKYRVVVNTSIGVLEKLKNVFGSNGSAKKTFNAADTGKTAMEQLKSDAKEFSNSARALISSGIKTNTDRIQNSVSNILKGGGTGELSDKDLGFDQIDQQLDDAQAESDKIEDSRKEFNETSKKQAEALEDQSSDTARYWDEASESWKTETGNAALSGEDDGKRDDVPNISDEAAKEKRAVDEQIQATRDRFEEKKAQIRQKSKEAANCNKQIQTLTASLDTQKALVNKRQGALDTLKANRLRDRFNFVLGEDSDAKLKELKEEYDILETELDLLKKSGALKVDIQAKQDEVDRAAAELDTYVSGMEDPPKTPYDDEIKTAEKELKDAKAALKVTEDALKAAKKKRDNLVKEIRKLYDEIAAADSTSDGLKVPDTISGKDKEKVSENALDFITSMELTFNKTWRELGKVAGHVNSNALSEFTFNLDSLTDDIWGTIEKMTETGEGIITLVTDPQQAGSAALFTDYVFGNFTFLTTQTMRENRHFQMAEIEYILQGDESQAVSLTKTVMDIALLRLTINWIDYMATTHSPEIISRMVIALGRAAIRTVKDMFSMIFTTKADGMATCALSPSFSKVQLSYSDHLRLAMMIRATGASGRANMMGRVQQMMKDTYEVQDWGDMGTRQTRIKADVTVDVDLVMLTLPMFEKVLPPDNQILQDGKFLVHESVDMGY